VSMSENGENLGHCYNGATDYGVKKALSDRAPEEILGLSETWTPWRSYATVLLWNSLAHKPEIQKGEV